MSIEFALFGLEIYFKLGRLKYKKEKKKKKIQIGIQSSTNKLSINQKQYIKVLFLNILRCNYLPIKTK